MKLLPEILESAATIKAIRRDIHAHPELCFQENRTAEVIAKQLERTELTHGPIGAAQADTIIAAGLALQEAAVVKADVDIKGVVKALIDSSYLPAK